MKKLDEISLERARLEDVTRELQHEILEHKRTNEALQASESFLRSLIDQSPYPMWISDGKGTLINLNKACMDLLDIAEEEVVGKYNILEDNIVEEQGLLPLVKRVFQAGESVRFKIKYDSSQLRHLKLARYAYVILDVTVFPVKDEHQNITNAVIQHIDITARERAEEELLRHRDHLDTLVKERTIELAVINSQLYAEIARREQAEETQKVTIELLNICNKATHTRELMRELVSYFKRFIGFDAVGVRLREGKDFPYYETTGFSEDFVQVENSLCSIDQKGELLRDSAGHPALNCMCGNIICGRFDSSKIFFTSHGSFWSSCTSELLRTTTEEERQAKTRNRCNGEGYESVALIPLRTQNETFGLFQFNDRRKGGFTAEKIAQIENLVSYVAIALAKLKTDESLRESEERFQLAMRGANDGLWDWNLLSDEVYYSPRWLSMLGYSENELEPHLDTWVRLLHPEDRKSALIKAQDFRDGRIGKYEVEFRLRHKHGHYVDILSRGILVPDSHGKAVRVVGTHVDITERKEGEVALRNYARRLMEMEEKMRKKLAAELHDEIGQELAALSLNLSFINSCIEKESWEDLRPRLEDSRYLTKEVSRAIRNIMTELRPPQLDEYGLVATVRWHADLFAERTGVAVALYVESRFPRLETEKEMALFRIVQEALNNVVKHAFATNVAIHLTSDAGTVQLTIADNGKGFAFETVPCGSTDSGWGLTIMRERAESIGGLFKVNSVPGEGTMVSVTLTEQVMDGDNNPPRR